MTPLRPPVTYQPAWQSILGCQLKEDTDRLEREGLVDPNAGQAAMDATAAVMSLQSVDEALRNLRNP